MVFGLRHIDVLGATVQFLYKRLRCQNIILTKLQLAFLLGESFSFIKARTISSDDRPW